MIRAIQNRLENCLISLESPVDCYSKYSVLGSFSTLCPPELFFYWCSTEFPIDMIKLRIKIHFKGRNKKRFKSQTPSYLKRAQSFDLLKTSFHLMKLNKRRKAKKRGLVKTTGPYLVFSNEKTFSQCNDIPRNYENTLNIENRWDWSCGNEAQLCGTI